MFTVWGKTTSDRLRLLKRKHPSAAHDWLTCFSFLLLLFTVSLIVWFALLSGAELQSGSDDIITHIMHHLLPALWERRNLRYTLTHTHTHTHIHTLKLQQQVTWGPELLISCHQCEVVCMCVSAVRLTPLTLCVWWDPNIHPGHTGLVFVDQRYASLCSGAVHIVGWTCKAKLEYQPGKVGLCPWAADTAGSQKHHAFCVL